MAFSLFVTGDQQKNAAVIRNITKLCSKEIPDNFDLSVIDILENPEIVKTEKILVTPTLIKKSPLPVVRVVGDFSSPRKISGLFRQIKMTSKIKLN